MWEKIKNSRFAIHVKNSRAVYVTVLTLILALSVLITVTAISNRAKKQNAEGDTPGQNTEQNADGEQNSGTDQSNGNNAVTPDDKGDNSNGTQTANTVPEMSLPVVGLVTKGYDSTVQVYSSTMGDYRIHLGLDMNTEDAAPVLAAADGVISQIWDDPMMGKCIAVSHSGECYTIYKNLDTSLPEGVTVGATVKAGDQIGSVGQSALLELAEEPHLHFEMTVDGLSVDPLEYFSEQAMAQLSEVSDVTETAVSVEE